MNMKKCFGLILVAFVAAGLLGGCAASKPQPVMTPLEMQSLQTREYEADKDVVFASVMSVFQDLGYSITEADKDTGLISAESQAEQDPTKALLLGINEITQTRASAFIERIGDKTTARLNFVNVTTQSMPSGQTNRMDEQLFEATLYQNAFERIENAIFVRTQG